MSADEVVMLQLKEANRKLESSRLPTDFKSVIKRALVSAERLQNGDSANPEVLGRAVGQLAYIFTSHIFYFEKRENDINDKMTELSKKIDTQGNNIAASVLAGLSGALANAAPSRWLPKYAILAICATVAVVAVCTTVIAVHATNHGHGDVIASGVKEVMSKVPTARTSP